MPGYKTGTIEKVPRSKESQIIDGTIFGDDGTPYKFRWPKAWTGDNAKKMSRGARVRFVANGGRATELKKSFAKGMQKY